MNYVGDSNVKNVAAFKGTNTAGGDAIVGQATGGGRGVVGTSDTQAGVVGTSTDWNGVYGHSDNQAAVAGVSENFVGVWGESHSPGQPGVFGRSPNWQGVHGESTNQAGVAGFSTNFVGVWGESQSKGHPGVFGKSTDWNGVYGESENQAAVAGISKNFVGVWGESHSAGYAGVLGKSTDWNGVYGESTNQAAVVGVSTNFDGVWGMSHSPDHAGVSGHNDKGGLAAYFEGNVVVTGDISLSGADCAEQFNIAGVETIEPGNVVVIDCDGALRQSQNAYDKKVAGVISGAGDYRPALVLDRHQSQTNRQPVALVGKVYCKVDAQYSSIEVGDLLTSSPTPGHAMKASDPARAFGSVIGKALRCLADGSGLIPVLVALQ